MNTKLIKLTGNAIAVAAFALALALPAQADEKTPQVDFVADCNDAERRPAGTAKIRTA